MTPEESRHDKTSRDSFLNLSIERYTPKAGFSRFAELQSDVL